MIGVALDPGSRFLRLAFRSHYLHHPNNSTRKEDRSSCRFSKYKRWRRSQVGMCNRRARSYQPCTSPKSSFRSKTILLSRRFLVKTLFSDLWLRLESWYHLWRARHKSIAMMSTHHRCINLSNCHLFAHQSCRRKCSRPDCLWRYSIPHHPFQVTRK